MVFSTAVQSSPLFRIPRSTIPLPKSALRLRDPRIIVLPQQASRSRVPNFPQDDSNLVDDPGKWRRAINSARGGIDDDEDDGNDDDEEERSLDLLVRFLRNMFQKVSKRARTAVRSVLPQAISTKLVVCTFGSAVFVSILLIRGVWSGVTYLQESRSQKMNGLDEEFHTWNGVQPVT
ncbi:uncharacterized protein LOC129300803 isoform X2 [Prosopis cineraria]|uniref:uncharacterized protein LOC129293878 isoform X2 n=1 Tax=Prosopis cineraria TaxID=364024 RepID=UPI00240F7E09|nr:uncharacterized protein LOC129293878 isoform X2 [Prosopis cineraria]XP_054795376.1 uncharacterized protein LOC129300803 isoform X2 [Prosopis cineraria]